ncbi:hypothetical protein [Phenylobacterium sp.]|uniref:hypothetical protein n=1 Tax=Phenylobacterium sp. TaxID=1871053 RepID=UPI002737503F|nr:hypothetical protein [Phenylobacterium sp.]MDP3659524.1 hypothetical protein [Phenylobacterium sp.]
MDPTSAPDGQNAARLYDTAPPSAPRSGLRALKAGLADTASGLLLPAMKRLAPDHVGGETLDEALAVAQALGGRGLANTLGFWDTPAYAPEQVAYVYRQAIARIGEAGGNGYVSIKPPALRFDSAVARELARAARDAGVRLHCDSHGIQVADLTLAFASDLAHELPPHLISVTTPGRWSRSLADAKHLLERGVGVRIVKGEWPDPDDAARDMRQGFLELAQGVAGAQAHVAIASHDAALSAEAISRVQQAGTPCELELIHGLQTDGLLSVASEAGVAARIYVPFGRGFVPSALRILRRNPGLAMQMLTSMITPWRATARA